MLSVLLIVSLKLAQHGWRHIDMPTKERYQRDKEYYTQYYQDKIKDNPDYNKGRYKNFKDYQAQYYQNRKNRPEYYEHVLPLTKLSNAKTRAKAQNLPFDITVQDIKDIWPKDNICPVLGIPFTFGVHEHKNYSACSLDKIIPSKGYVKGNIQIVSALANQIMSSATPEQVLQVGHYFKKLIDSK
tara:strand:- start:16 stop:570 length:555 start_codon:yes stop_codon:yes gene_type:complete